MTKWTLVRVHTLLLGTRWPFGSVERPASYFQLPSRLGVTQRRVVAAVANQVQERRRSAGESSIACRSVPSWVISSVREARVQQTACELPYSSGASRRLSFGASRFRASAASRS